MGIYLDLPYEDEALCSVVSRYALTMEVGRRAEFLRSLFGYQASNGVALAYNLSHVAGETARAWGMSAEQIAHQLTAIDYFCAFMKACDAEHFFTYCLERRASKPIRRFLDGLVLHFGARYCSACWRDDRSRGLTPYWRRSHQLPGVICCIQHGCLLSVTSQSGLWFDAKCQAPIKPLHFEAEAATRLQVHFRVAQLSADVLIVGQAALLSRDPRAWLRILRDRGYARGKDQIDAQRLCADFGEFFGTAYLDAVGLAPKHYQNWLVGRLYGRQKGLAPLATVLLLVFLELCLQKRFQRWQMCPNPFASHGPNHEVDFRERIKGVERYACGCGFSFVVRYQDAERTEIVTTVYGPEYAAGVQRLHGGGVSIVGISRRLGVGESTVRRMLEQVQSYTRCTHSEMVATLRLQWRELVEQCGSVTLASRTNQALWRRAKRYCPDIFHCTQG